MKNKYFNVLAVAILALAAGLSWSFQASAQSDPLPSWNDTPTKQAIVDFVGRVTKTDGPDFLAPAERIATFDNDGTLWAEQPMYVQMAFALDRVKALAPLHPEWKDTQPFKAVLEGDMKSFAEAGERGLVEVIMATHAGMTTDEFSKIVTNWLTTARDPRFKRPHTELIYWNLRTWVVSAMPCRANSRDCWSGPRATAAADSRSGPFLHSEDWWRSTQSMPI